MNKIVNKTALPHSDVLVSIKKLIPHVSMFKKLFILFNFKIRASFHPPPINKPKD